MESVLDRLIVELAGRDVGYANMLNQSVAVTQRATGMMAGALAGVEGMAARAMSTIAGLGVSLSGVGLLRSAVSLAASAETMEISFGTMLGSAERGKAMMKDLIQFAAETPLELPGIMQATRLLLNYGVAGERVIPIMRQLGDIAGGEQDRFQRLSLVYGQVMTAGRLLGQDLRQMQEAGFNPLQTISQMTGRSMAQLTEEMHHGAISAQMVVDAFQAATSSGGRFNNLMMQQSQTVGGLFSTLRDNVRNALRVVGKDIIETLNLREVIRQASGVANAVEGWLTMIPPGAKSAAAGILLAVGAMTAFGAATFVAGAAFNVAFGGLPIIAGLLITGSAALAGWAFSFKEVRVWAADAWAGVKKSAGDFLVWFYPVWQAAASFGGTVWGVVKDMAGAAWDAIKVAAGTAGAVVADVWKSITGGSDLTWTSVRDMVRDTFLFAEFSVTHFGQVAKYVWAESKTAFLEYAAAIADSGWLSNALRAFGGPAVGAALDAFPRQNQAALREAGRQSREALDAMALSFEDFRRNKLATFSEVVTPAKVKPAVEQAAAAGTAIGDAFARNALKEIHKFDAALVGSAEDMARLAHYQDQLDAMRRQPAPPPARAEEAFPEIKNRRVSLPGLAAAVVGGTPAALGALQPDGSFRAPGFDPGVKSPAGRGEFGPSILDLIGFSIEELLGIPRQRPPVLGHTGAPLLDLPPRPVTPQDLSGAFIGAVLGALPRPSEFVGPPRPDAALAAGIGGAASAAMPAQATQVQVDNSEVVAVLNAIRDILQRRPAIEIEPADLEAV